jgi:hypothetical protein
VKPITTVNQGEEQPIMQTPTCTVPSESTTVKKSVRRGTTLMEYLLMLSLVFVACLVAIGYLGGINAGSLSNSANAINNSLKKGS